MINNAAISCWMLLLLAAAAMSVMGESFLKVIQALPKLADYHFPRILSGMGYVAMSILAFLAGSFLLVMQFQFVCIAARQFGRYHIAGGIILFLVLCFVEGIWNHGESLGFLVVLLSSAACFAGSSWLLKHRLSV